MPKTDRRFIVGRVPLAVAISVAAGIGVLFYVLGAVTTAEDETADEPLTVRVAPATRENGYTVRRTYTGRLEARRRSRVGFELGGEVVDVAVDDGQRVKQGDLVARLDTLRLEAQRAELLAARDEAEANAELARATYIRAANAFEAGAASDQELDDAEDAREAANAALRRAHHAVNRVDVEIRKSSIVAPFDAVVARRFVDEGAVIQAGAPVALLLERERPEARIGVPPAVAQRLAPSDPIAVTVRGESFDGTLRELLPVTNRGTRTVEAVIELATTLDGVRDGDLATISVPRHIDTPGFWLPIDALTESVRGLWACYVAEPNGTEDGDAGDGDANGQAVKRTQRGTHIVAFRQLELLHTDGELAFVTGTLQPGELLITQGLHRIVAGDPVKPTQLRDDDSANSDSDADSSAEAAS